MWVCLTAKKCNSQLRECAVSRFPEFLSSSGSLMSSPRYRHELCLPSDKSALTIIQNEFIFDRSYLKEYQKRVFGASCFCLASYAFSKTAGSAPGHILLPPHPPASLLHPLCSLCSETDAEPCHLTTFLCSFIGFHLGSRVKFQRHSYHSLQFRLRRSFLVKQFARK